jgi:hypothetical protein
MGDRVVVGGVGGGEVEGAEGAGSFNELYQLVVTSPQPPGAEGTGQSGAKSQSGAGWVEVQDRGGGGRGWRKPFGREGLGGGKGGR